MSLALRGTSRFTVKAAADYRLISLRFKGRAKIIHSGSHFVLSAFVYTGCASRGRIRGFSEEVAGGAVCVCV